MAIGENGHLYIGGCDTTELATEYGTPLFVYDEQLLRDTIRGYHNAFRKTGASYRVTYASKAFCTVAMCQLAAEEDCAIDVVSGGELYTALAAGVDPSRIYMHGNNKTEDELEYAVSSGIGAIVVDNFNEIELISQVAERHHKTVDVMLRISPGVEAHTHEHISTGQQDSKFGFDLALGQAAEALRLVAASPRLSCIGLHVHIGSQIFDTAGFTISVERLVDLYASGVKLGLPFTVLNLGGGFGIRYTDEDDPEPVDRLISEMVDTVRSHFSARGVTEPSVWIEPGRSVVGPAGTTLYRAGSKKEIPGVRNYVAIDGGMTDNPRFALYGAKYEALVANRATAVAGGAWTIAGKCCESGDLVARDALLAEPATGDVIAVFATGAYNYSMASHYNRLPHPAVVFVKDGEAKVVVERETWADVARQDRPLR
ncbi:diaminopimelate decarboxylase [Alicyclobacillus sp. ALC3]|uniref:diaminopimelate decarboxylase n=1 Tax=Alicyclobacillus sp. ALC3 TaxID=2796143 RepID=UPI00237896CA|nr:diaminopimelate decarboxylase [Alicyclobacillus sp. ALC3]WDL99372.1 diaminopimelate decarboxylase [Alicyclobacillus sp. ALC3]